jgi:hypothetical protein
MTLSTSFNGLLIFLTLTWVLYTEYVFRWRTISVHEFSDHKVRKKYQQWSQNPIAIFFLIWQQINSLRSWGSHCRLRHFVLRSQT